MSLKGHLPNLIIIGAPKCGTTSLHYYLDLHPGIQMSRRKELDFFLDRRAGARGADRYRRWFRGEVPVHGESSPKYANRFAFPGVPERMHRLIPEARLIYLVRDPIARAVSHYVQGIREGFEIRPLDRCLRPFAPTNTYIGFSLYFAQLQAFLEHYDRSRILVASLEELANDRPALLRRVFRFVGVDETFTSPQFDAVLHRSEDRPRLGPWVGRLKYTAEAHLPWLLSERVRTWVGRRVYAHLPARVPRPVVSDALREELTAGFRGDVQQLRVFTGARFEGWSL